MNSQASIAEVLRQAAAELSTADIPEPVKEARDLLALAAGREKQFVIAHPEYELSPKELESFSEFVGRRISREPFQHISRKQEFYGLEFFVSPDVLIPRPETELIVEAGIELLQDIDEPMFCEVGTGSGCITVSLLHTLTNARAVGLEISEAALRITEQNALANSVWDRLELRRSDVFEALGEAERFDLIVSNPPYVPAADIDSLQAEVREFEPHIALTDGADGLSIIERIIAAAPGHIRSGGSLLLEIGFNQGQSVQTIFRKHGWKQVELFPDLQGIPRMVKARFSGT